MRLQIQFKNKLHPMQEQFRDIAVDRIVINPPNSVLVSHDDNIDVLLISTMARMELS